MQNFVNNKKLAVKEKMTASFSLIDIKSVSNYNVIVQSFPLENPPLDISTR